jgi:hypothetical protein
MLETGLHVKDVRLLRAERSAIFLLRSSVRLHR